MPQLISALREFTTGAINLVFPTSCVHCGRDGALLCDVCIADSTSLLRNVCRKCAEPLPKPGTCARCAAERSPLDRLYGSYLYETPVGSAVRAFKFDDVRALGSFLGSMFDVDAMARSDADLVVPIPMHRTRLRSRGYNQSEVFGRVLAKRMNVLFENDVLVRTRATLPQSEQPTAVARESAMSGAISFRPETSGLISEKRILLVDDVFTTGSTIKAAAAALKSSGAAWVGAAALTVQPIGSLK